MGRREAGAEGGGRYTLGDKPYALLRLTGGVNETTVGKFSQTKNTRGSLHEGAHVQSPLNTTPFQRKHEVIKKSDI